MTQSAKDKATRLTAVPFTASSYGSNLGLPNYEDTVQPVDWTTGLSIAAGRLRTMRMSKPDVGNLIQAYLILFMTAGSSLSAKIAIGRFDTDGVTAVIPNQVEIDASHLKLTGSSSAIASSGGNLIIDGLNLLKQIPKKGETNYNADGFVLIVQFDRDLTTSDYPRRFEVACSMQMGLL